MASESSGWLASLIEHEIAAYWDDARALVKSAFDRYPGASPDIIVNEVIDSKARLAGFIGLGTGAIQSIPGIGQAIQVGTLLPEALYLAKMQVDVALVVALVYDSSLSKTEVQAVITTCLVLALGADFIKANLLEGARVITAAGVEAAIASRGGTFVFKLLEKAGINATTEGFLKWVPVISVPANAALNYGQIHSFAWTAKKLLSPSFVMCGSCGMHTGRLNKFCPKCGSVLSA